MKIPRSLKGRPINGEAKAVTQGATILDKNCGSTDVSSEKFKHPLPPVSMF